MIVDILLVLFVAGYLAVAGVVAVWSGIILDPYGHDGMSRTARIFWAVCYGLCWFPFALWFAWQWFRNS